MDWSIRLRILGLRGLRPRWPGQRHQMLAYNKLPQPTASIQFHSAKKNLNPLGPVNIAT